MTPTKRLAFVPSLGLGEGIPGVAFECIVEVGPLLVEHGAVEPWEGRGGPSFLYKVRLRWRERCIEVAQILSKWWGDGDCWEEERLVVVDSSGGVVSWVLFAWDVLSMEKDALLF